MSPFAAEVSSSDRHAGAIVEATVPLRAPREDGKLALVQLGLEADGDHFESRNPLAAVSYSKDPRDGATLERANVAVSLAGVSADRKVEVRDDRVVVPDAAPDTDLWMAPTPAGFRTFAVLRSIASPERLVFHIDLPTGATLHMGPGETAVIARGDETITSISAPMATDADGIPVPVSMSVEDSSLVLAIPHRDKDLRYPLLVDPEYRVDSWDWWNEYTEEEEDDFFDYGGWTNYTYNPGTFDSTYLFLENRWFGGLYEFTHEGAYVKANEFTEYRFDPPGTSTRVFKSTMVANTNGKNGCFSIGISDATGGGKVTGCGTLEYTPFEQCVTISCSSSDGHAENYAYFRISSNTSETRTFSNKLIGSLTYASVSYADSDLPTFEAVNSGPAGSWAQSYSGEVKGPIRDNGVGMAYFDSLITDSTWEEKETVPCEGAAWDPCPRDLDTNLPIDGEELNDGKHELRLSGEDALGHKATETWGNIWLDRGGPTIATPSGSLWEKSDQTNSEGKAQAEAKVLEPGKYDLKVTASDGVSGGSSSEQRSGVKSVEIKVDGEAALQADSVSCPAGSCSDTREWTLDTAEFPAGERLVTIIAKDQVGNFSSRSFHVKTPPAGELEQPVKGTKTSRWLQLKAHADASGYSSVRFQARKVGGSWANIPLAALSDREGNPIESVEQPIEASVSPLLNWEVAKTFTPPITGGLTQLQVRAIFSGSEAGGTSNTVPVAFDPRGLTTDDARAPIGPGEVNLATGNFNVTASDASMDSWGTSLAIARSFNSRDPEAGASGPFGPGWTMSAPVEGASDYASLTVVTNPYGGEEVELKTSGGESIMFYAQSGQYIPEPGYETLALSRPSESVFELQSDEGTSVLFSKQAGTSGAIFVPSQMSQPGSMNISKASYQVVGGVPRLIEVVAPAPSGVSCTSPLSTPGCRTLMVYYGASTTASGTNESSWGNYAGRVTEIRFTAYDPAEGKMTTDAISRYLYDSTGRLRAQWDPRISPALKTRYTYDEGGRISQVTPPGQSAWTMGYAKLEGDSDGGRLKSVSRTGPAGTATMTMAYNVPLVGEAAPHEMAPSNLANWAQTLDLPVGATAIFPPDTVPSNPPTDYGRATIHYLDRAGREVNTSAPGQGVSTTEYDGYGNVIRELSAPNRARALAAGENSAEVAQALDAQRTFTAEGTEMIEELGPEHTVRLENGETVRARARTTTTYDEGAPSGKDPHLPTQTTTQAKVTGGSNSADARTTKTEYDWTLQKPTKTIKDVGGLNLTERWTYDATTGLETQHFDARHPESAPARVITYYRAGTGSTVEACNSKPYWANLPCNIASSATQADAPADKGLPATPEENLEYNRLNQPTKVSRLGEARQLVTSTEYDAAGRKVETATAEPDPTDGLVLGFGFEDNEKWTTADESGNGNTGYLTNVDHSSFGRFGRAMKFDSSSDKITVGSSESLAIEGPATFEAWVRPNSIGSSAQKIIEHTGPGSGMCMGPSYALYASMSSGSPQPRAYICSFSATAPESSKLPAGAWSHVAATINANKYLSIYVNGQQVLSGKYFSNPIRDVLGQLLIGPGFSGLIDEVRIYDRALSSLEIRHDMVTPIKPGASQEAGKTHSGLVGAFGFEDNPYSTEAIDSSASGLKASVPRSNRAVGGRFGAGLRVTTESAGTTTYDESAAYDTSGGFTVSAWIEPLSLSTSGSQILSRCESYAVETFEEGKLAVYVGGAGFYYLETASKVLHANTPTNIAISYDNETLKLFVNGSLVASEEGGGPVLDDGCPITFGHFDGFMDELRVYDRALTGAEIQEDSENPIAAPSGIGGEEEETDLPAVHFGYDESTGLPITEAVLEGEEVIEGATTTYNAIGQVQSYEDALGNVSDSYYDIDGRLSMEYDGLSYRYFEYDSVTGALTAIEDSDSNVGTFEAEYDGTGQLIAESYPNGLVQRLEYDETGSPIDLSYEKDSCLGCSWYDEHVIESINGQWLDQENTFGHNVYSYDKVGRLTQVKETPSGKGCTTRTYAYDADSNRQSEIERSPGGGGACVVSGGGVTQSSTYDGADRINGAGFKYDTYSRVTEVPSTHSGGGPLALSYYTNDLTRVATQDGKSVTTTLDVTQNRPKMTTETGGSTTYFYYAGTSDSPAWTEEVIGGEFVGRERYVSGIDGSLAATVSYGGTTTTEFQLTDLHGDIVGLANADSEATEPVELFHSNEFGEPIGSGKHEYGWLGAKKRRTTLESGVIQMGVRTYVPAMGRFTSIDPVYGGSANSYDYAIQDPLQNLDLDGNCTRKFHFSAKFFVGVQVTAYLDRKCTESLVKPVNGVAAAPTVFVIGKVCGKIAGLFGGPVLKAIGLTCQYVVEHYWMEFKAAVNNAYPLNACLTFTAYFYPRPPHFGVSRDRRWCKKK